MVAESGDDIRTLGGAASIDGLLTSPSPFDTLSSWFEQGTPCDVPHDHVITAPIGTQEVWAAGVTYLRSRVARVAESKEAGGDTFYDLVYDAERPELFFKATPHRVVGHHGAVRIRSDSTWDVPEPEFTLVVDRAGSIIGHTAGNDMSSRSIEGENPLYLPQAKVFSACASLGPRLIITDAEPPPTTAIAMSILRSGAEVFRGDTTIDRIKRGFDELVGFLFRDNDFPSGAFLMTGTGIVPGDEFTLHEGDEIHITVDGVGTLVNHVADRG
ncbi:MAG: fumarylacetoacetate hydrolase family protein [Ilumatobacteraceae bacterium]